MGYPRQVQSAAPPKDSRVLGSVLSVLEHLAVNALLRRGQRIRQKPPQVVAVAKRAAFSSRNGPSREAAVFVLIARLFIL